MYFNFIYLRQPGERIYFFKEREFEHPNTNLP